MDPARLIAAVCSPAGRYAVVEVHERLGSTNSRAVSIAQPYAVVVAEAQTAGRGRLDRTWESPTGLGLTFSALLPAPTSAPGWVPLVAGLAVAEAITAVTGLRPALKWPNDVLIGQPQPAVDGPPVAPVPPVPPVAPVAPLGKVCGILCEYLPLAHPLVVVGIGLNVHQQRPDLPVPTATSLALACGGRGAVTGQEIDRETVLVEVLDRLAQRVAQLGLPPPEREATYTAYRQQCATLGSLVTVTLPDGSAVTGTAVAVDADGALLVDNGWQVHTLRAGDVTHVRPARDPI